MTSQRLFAYFRALVRRRRIAAETDEELRFHLEMETDELLARGLPPEEARRAAFAAFGGLTQTREGVRAVRTTWLDGFWQDIRYAARLWRRQPIFTAVALLTLALGIGATTAIASAAYGVFLRPLPVHDEGTLFIGYATRTDRTDREPLSWPAFQAWRESQVFDDVAAVTTARAELTDGVAERISIQQVTGNFFQVLGVTATVGRVLSESDDDALETPAVISDALWRSRFSADPAIIGRRLQAGRFSVTVVGIVAERVDRWRGSHQMWIPINRTVSERELSGGYHLFTPVGRFAPARSQDASDRLTPITAAIDGRRITRVSLIPLRDDVSSPRLHRILLVLFAGVCITWLAVCANLSNLLLARGPARAGELTVRLAVGATRARIVRQLLSESAVLAMPGGILGVWVAFVAIQTMASTSAVGAFNSAELELSAPVLAFAILITMLSVLACGMVPALTAGRASLARGIALEIGGTSRRWSGGLVTAEIAMGLVVLIAAALLVKSVGRINGVDLGFDGRRVLTFQVTLPTTSYGTPTSIHDDRYLAAQRELLSRLSALPGVEGASFGAAIFFPGITGGRFLSLDDGRELREAPFAPGMTFTGPDYFAVHAVPVLRGREFSARDDFSTERVVVINEAMAALIWPKEDPIGRRVNFGLSSPKKGFDEPWAEIVGIVANVRHGGIDAALRPFVYRAAMQYPRQDFSVMLRTSGPPDSLSNAARAEVRAFDRSVPMFATKALAETVDDASADVRQGSALLASLAALTVILAGVGVFSVLAYVVTARRRDLAIRAALGATPAALAGSVMRHALSMLAPGIVAGLVGAFVAVGSLRALLYEVEPTDPAVFIGATVAVMAVAFVAAYVPSRRAARLDPIRALKE